MKKGVLKNIFCVFFSCLVLSSCGVLSDKPVDENEKTSSSILGKSCEINSKAFEKFLETPIPEEISCLEQNLNQYVQYVKRKDERYVEYKDLAQFVRKFFPENASDLQGALKIFFKVNGLLLNDPEDRLLVKNLPTLFKLLVLINKETATVHRLIDENNQRKVADSWKLRSDIEDSLKEFSSLSLSLIPELQNGPSSINLNELLDDVEENMPKFNLDKQKISSFFVIKSILLGGDKNELNAKEFRHFLELLPELGLLSFDLFYLKENAFENPSERSRYFSKRLETLRTLIYPAEPQKVLFQKADLEKMLSAIEVSEKNKKFVLDGFDLMKNHLLKAKSSRSELNFSELQNLVSYAQVVLEGSAGVQSAQKIFDETQDKNVFESSSKFVGEIQKTKERLKAILLSPSLFPKEIKLRAFIEDVNELFELNESEHVIDTIIGAKKLLVGGEEKTLTKDEILKLLDKSPDLGWVIFEGMKAPQNIFEKDYHYYDFLLVRFTKLIELLRQDYKGREEIFNIESLLITIDRFAKKDFSKYLPSVEKILEKIYQNDAKTINYQTVVSLLNDAREVLERMVFSSSTYDHYQNRFDNPAPITENFPLVWLSSYNHIRQELLVDFQNDFNKIAVNYRFFADENSLQYYGKDIHRFREGFLTASFYKWGVRKIFSGYGHLLKDFRAPLKREINVDEFNALLLDAKSILEANNLWTKKIKSFANNCVLLTDLFQYQSDGTLTINEDELTEYVILLFAALKINDGISENLAKRCRMVKVTDPLDKTQEIEGHEQTCVLEHYGNIFFETLNLKERFPEFYRYQQSSGQEEFTRFLKSTLGFTRDYSAEIPLSKRELILLTGALLNIESTLLRFDLDNNSKINDAEMDKMFQVYKNAIVAVAKLTPSQEKYANSVFLYMAKYMAVPTPAQLAKFHYLQSKKGITANRLTIGVILYYLVQQSNQNVR